MKDLLKKNEWIERRIACLRGLIPLYKKRLAEEEERWLAKGSEGPEWERKQYQEAISRKIKWIEEYEKECEILQDELKFPSKEIKVLNLELEDELTPETRGKLYDLCTKSIPYNLFGDKPDEYTSYFDSDYFIVTKDEIIERIKEDSIDINRMTRILLGCMGSNNKDFNNAFDSYQEYIEDRDRQIVRLYLFYNVECKIDYVSEFEAIDFVNLTN